MFLQHTKRPELTGGVRKSTYRIYASNLESALKFFEPNRIKYWNQIDAHVLEKYVRYLGDKKLAPKTIAEKVKQIKQAMKWLIEEGHLSGCEPVKLKLARFESQRNYCWTTYEVEAILAHCKADPGLAELHDVSLCLAATGLRISELASLRWTDFDAELTMLRLSDESGLNRQSRRQLKNGRSRSLPVHPELRAVLQKRPRTSVYVFPAARGGQLSPRHLREKFTTQVVQKLADRFPTVADEQGFQD